MNFLFVVPLVYLSFLFGAGLISIAQDNGMWSLASSISILLSAFIGATLAYKAIQENKRQAKLTRTIEAIRSLHGEFYGLEAKKHLYNIKKCIKTDGVPENIDCDVPYLSLKDVYSNFESSFDKVLLFAYNCELVATAIDSGAYDEDTFVKLALPMIQDRWKPISLALSFKAYKEFNNRIYLADLLNKYSRNGVIFTTPIIDDKSGDYNYYWKG